MVYSQLFAGKGSQRWRRLVSRYGYPINKEKIISDDSSKNTGNKIAFVALFIAIASLYFSWTNANRIYQLEIEKQRPVIELNYPSNEKFLSIGKDRFDISVPLVNHGAGAAKEFKSILNVAILNENKVVGIKENIFPPVPYVKVLPGSGISPAGWYELSDKKKFVNLYKLGTLKIFVWIQFSYQDSFNREFLGTIYILLDKDGTSFVDDQEGKRIWEKIRSKEEPIQFNLNLYGTV